MSFLYFIIAVLNYYFVCLARCENVVIGAVVSDQFEADALQVAREDILANWLFRPELNFSFITKIGCSNGKGLENAAMLYYTEGVKALIGPNCDSEISCVSKLSARWKLPVLTTAIAGGDAYTESLATLIKVSPLTSGSQYAAIISFIAAHRWTNVVILYNASDTTSITESLSISQGLEAEMNNVVVTLVKVALGPDDEVRDVDIDIIKNSARVIILAITYLYEKNLPLLQYFASNSILPTDYVIIMPWIRRSLDNLLPWQPLNPIDNKTISIDLKVLRTFADTIVIDTPNDKTDVTRRFFSTLMSRNLLPNDAERMAWRMYVFYDALLTYMIAANRSYSLHGPPAFSDPNVFFGDVHGIQFEGASGFIEMDANLNRIPYYKAFKADVNDPYALAELANLKPATYTCTNDSDEMLCYHFTSLPHTVATYAQLVAKGSEPDCGFSHQKCSYIVWYIVGGCVLLVALLSGAFVVLYRMGCIHCLTSLNKAAAAASWQVPVDKVKIIKAEEQSLKSESELSMLSGLLRAAGESETAIVFNNVVNVRRFRQVKTIHLDRDEAELLLFLKQLVHDNLNPMIGICYNNPTNEFLLLSKFCLRGTLKSYLLNSEMRMDIKFKTAFISDIINGLLYIHNGPLGYYGKLSTSTCVIDSNFIVKLVCVGVDEVIDDWKRKGYITDVDADRGDDNPPKSTANSTSGEVIENDDLIFRAPEFLRQEPPTRAKLIHMSKTEQIRLKLLCKMGDIYSFSMVCYEVLFRKHPFSDVSLSLDAILNRIRNPNYRLLRPEVPEQQMQGIHPGMIQLMQLCWSEDPNSRPPTKRIRQTFSTLYKIKGGLVDSIIQMMDHYAVSLEKQVRERTRLLEEAQLRADRLLAQMIPKDVARDLKLGRPVLPRTFNDSSVLFTDIVGFTNICGQSTPIEIVNFLNDLFTGYDAIISQEDAYKVETIGDAYMVVSGVPTENGSENIKVIATIALKMREYLSVYKLPHIPDHVLNARWGIHTGSVAAGVVGLIAPRYCLFGDTVNVASRMESTGQAGMIQASLEFYDAATARKDAFKFEKRGTIAVKGKGDCLTYWLLGADTESSTQLST